jgi:hypothetical protein
VWGVCYFGPSKRGGLGSLGLSSRKTRQCSPSLGPTLYPIEWLPGLFPGRKQREHQVDNPPPSRKEGENDRSCSFLSPIFHELDRNSLTYYTTGLQRPQKYVRVYKVQWVWTSPHVTRDTIHSFRRLLLQLQRVAFVLHRTCMFCDCLIYYVLVTNTSTSSCSSKLSLFAYMRFYTAVLYVYNIYIYMCVCVYHTHTHSHTPACVQSNSVITSWKRLHILCCYNRVLLQRRGTL